MLTSLTCLSFALRCSVASLLQQVHTKGKIKTNHIHSTRHVTGVCLISSFCVFIILTGAKARASLAVSPALSKRVLKRKKKYAYYTYVLLHRYIHIVIYILEGASRTSFLSNQATFIILIGETPAVSFLWGVLITQLNISATLFFIVSNTSFSILVVHGPFLLYASTSITFGIRAVPHTIISVLKHDSAQPLPYVGDTQDVLHGIY